MIRVEADVLVEMEHLDPAPVEVVSCGERVEEVELRRASGDDDARGAMGVDGAVDR